MTRVLLLSHTTGYQLRAFNDAAERLGIELLFATDRCHMLDDPWQDQAVPVKFYDIERSLDAIVQATDHRRVDGIIAVGDRPVALAAHAAEVLGIPWHTPEGALASVDKRRSRAALAASGLPSPSFDVIPVDLAPRSPNLALLEPRTSNLRYPCVLKPVGLSGSRGVIRADTREEFAAAFYRIRALLARPQVRVARAGLEDEILVEEFIPGQEFAIEGVLTRGVLTTFAIFDKPDRLDGPFFEETIYVTPSRLPADLQRRVSSRIQAAARALGLTHGPVHAECRVNGGRIYVLEVAARPIGGLCSRGLRFANQVDDNGERVSLENVLLRHAIGESIGQWGREPRAAAVMMIPIPASGLFRGVVGEEQAWAVPGVEEIRITAKTDQVLEPVPEAGSYLGFIFAFGTTPQDAEHSVRAAHERLTFRIERSIAVQMPRASTI
jgi:biotin carboxylase